MRTRRLLLGSAIVLLAAVGLGFALTRDRVPTHAEALAMLDPSLRLPPPDNGGEQRFREISAAASFLDRPDLRTAWRKLVRSNKGPLSATEKEQAGDFLRAHGADLDGLARLLRAPGRMAVATSTSTSTNAIHTISRAFVASSKVAAEWGDNEQAARLLADAGAFASRSDDCTGAGAIELRNLAVVDVFFAATGHIRSPSLTPEQYKAILREMPAASGESAAARSSLIHHFHETVLPALLHPRTRQPDEANYQQSNMGLEDPLVRAKADYRATETIHYLADLYRESLAAMERPWDAGQAKLEALAVNPIRQLRPFEAGPTSTLSSWDRLKRTYELKTSSNLLGKLLIDRYGEEAGHAPLAQAALTEQYEVSRLLFALCAYKKAHGDLPERLGVLVDKGILSELPRDPFSGGNFRYEKKRFLLWSVGPDQVDDTSKTISPLGSVKDSVVILH